MLYRFDTHKFVVTSDDGLPLVAVAVDTKLNIFYEPGKIIKFGNVSGIRLHPKSLDGCIFKLEK